MGNPFGIRITNPFAAGGRTSAPEDASARPGTAPARKAPGGGGCFGPLLSRRKPEAASHPTPRASLSDLMNVERRAEAAAAGPPRAMTATDAVLKSALPRGGSAALALRRAEREKTPSPSLSPAPGEEGREFANFMNLVQRDVRTLADKLGGGCSLADAAETMRQAIVDGRLADGLNHGQRAQLLYALHGVRAAARGKDRLEDELRTAPGFRQLPMGHAWRMLMDAQVWGDGRHGGLRFENEPGYMGGMYTGLATMLAAHREGRPLDARLLVQLHDAATDGVIHASAQRIADLENAIALTDPARNDTSVDEAVRMRALFEPGYKPFGVPVTFGLIAGRTLTPGGLEELLSSQAQMPEGLRCSVLQSISDNEIRPIRQPSDWDGRSNLTLLSPPLSARQNAAKAQAIIDDCRREARAATSDDGQLAAIARCVRQLEQAHLFTDGNARTTGYLALNKLLMEAGQPPAMIEDPNRFDGFTVAELVQEIRKGQALFAQYSTAART